MRQGLSGKRGVWLVMVAWALWVLIGCGVSSPNLGIKADDRYQLAQQYLGSQSYILAEQEIRKALDLVPEEPKYFELLALIYQAQGRIRQAEEAYKVALQSDAISPSTLVNYSTLLLLREQYDEAINTSQRALQKPGYARPALAHTNIGLAYLKQGKLAQAEEQFLIALDYQPGLAEAHHNLGLVYERLGQRTKAILSFREAIRSSPGYTEAHASLGRLLLQDGRPEEARNAFERVIDLAPDSELAVASRRHLKRLPR
ncbi:MAG: tetratricopeptide repeat protein [Candidatus Tectomicrobia bacterium]|nr:tetratricopeptide repeat protein [Candidatus Tectomicrobia bacterium]